MVDGKPVPYRVILIGDGDSPRAAHESALYAAPDPVRLTCSVPGCTHSIVINGKPLCCLAEADAANLAEELEQIADLFRSEED